MNYLSPPAQSQHTTPLWKALLAGVSIFFGALCLLGLFFTNGFREFVGALLLAVALVTPGRLVLFA